MQTPVSRYRLSILGYRSCEQIIVNRSDSDIYLWSDLLLNHDRTVLEFRCGNLPRSDDICEGKYFLVVLIRKDSVNAFDGYRLTAEPRHLHRMICNECCRYKETDFLGNR